MKKQKLFFILSILGILILLFLTTTTKPIIQGKVESINYGNNKITLQLENHNQEIILFSNQILNLQQGQDISIQGREEIYKNKTQIIADKIIKLN
tara:strand:- start:319 stop:603 length:285 start_codon:yes stop_codon:yes gene_type:complete